MKIKGEVKMKADKSNYRPMQSVGMKLFVTLLCSIVGLVGILGAASYFKSKEIIKSKVADASMQTIVQATDKLNYLLGIYESESRRMMVDPEITTNFAAYTKPDGDYHEGTKARDVITNKLNAMVSSDKRIAAVRLIPTSFDKNKIIASAGTTSVSMDLNNEDMKRIIKAEGGIVWFPSRQKGFFGLSKETTFTAGRLMKNLKNKHAEAVILFEIKQKALDDLFANVKIGESGSVNIITSENRVVRGKDAAAAEQPFGYGLKTDGKNGQGTEFVSGTGGGEQIAVYKLSGPSGWYVVGMAPVSELVRETKEIFTLTLMIALAALLVAVGIGYWLIRMVGRPLQNLSTLMEKGERGDLSVRIDLKSRDEIGRLGQSFNRMMEEIRKLVEKSGESASELASTALELSRVSQKTADSAKEIAAATEEIAHGASSLATEAEKGTGITGKVGLAMERAVNINEQMESAAVQVRNVSGRGADYMDELIRRTNATEEMVREMAVKVNHLRESADSIRQIMELLNGISRQTHILSLNAGIEAARSGAAGKGFMVISNEIRQLADQSRESIEIVSGITETIQTDVAGTVSVLALATPLFAEQLESVKEAALIFRDVREHMEKFNSQLTQSTASIHELENDQQELADSIGSVNTVSEEASAASEEVASLCTGQLAVSEDLVNLSLKLQKLSEELRSSLEKYIA